MQAAVGDRLHVHANVVGHPGRTGEIVEVRGAGGEPPYLVRSTTVTPRWCSPARTRSSSIRARRQEGAGEGLALDVFRANVERCLPLLRLSQSTPFSAPARSRQSGT